MAKIVDNKGYYDYFEAKCPHCGSTVRYSRREIKAHNRWPNGFIYCPKCKTPIGHEENYYVGNHLTGDKNDIDPLLVNEAPKTDDIISDSEYIHLKGVLALLTTLRILFLIFGIVGMIGGTIFGIIALAVLKEVHFYVAIGIVLFSISLIVVRAAVFGNLHADRKLLVDKYEYVKSKIY